MKERPILFNAPMVRAVLAGDKTQTRRTTGLEYFSRPDNDPDGWWCARVADGQAYMVYKHSPHERAVRCPYGQAGDRLWVRESVRAEEQPSGLDGVRYLADDALVAIEDSFDAAAAWLILHRYRGKRGATVPPMHMPRWACRLVLEVTRVRVERLQAISYMDALAEGAFDAAAFVGQECTDTGESADELARRLQWPQRAFRELWCRLNGADAWDANPWVWVVEFRVLTRLDKQEATP